TVLSMLTLVCHVKKVMHRGWAYFQARLAFTMAAFNVLVQWHSFRPGQNGVSNSLYIKRFVWAFRRGFLARSSGTMKMGLYARVSTHDQQTLPLQRDALRAYARQRGGAIVTMVEDVGSGASERRRREELMRAARRRDIDAIVVWRLDRWGRSLAD